MAVNRFELADLENAIRNLKAAFPEVADDEDFLADVLEGETDLHAVIGKLVDQAREQKAMEQAVVGMLETLEGRIMAWRKRQEATRSLMLKLLNVAGVRKVTLPQATVSIANGRKRVEIIDEAQLPASAWVVDKRVSKALVKDLLEIGDCPGAAFSNGEETLTIR